MNGHRLKSMAIPLVLIALIQIVVGGSVYLRSDAQLTGLSAQLQTNPQVVKLEETARMQTVMKTFPPTKPLKCCCCWLAWE
jgi:hypothetical protein